MKQAEYFLNLCLGSIPERNWVKGIRPVFTSVLAHQSFRLTPGKLSREREFAAMDAAVETLLSPYGFREEQRNNLRLAYLESVANACDYGAPNKHVRVDVYVVKPLACLVVVRDHGQGFNPVARDISMPEVDATRGRGLPIAAALAEALGISDTGNIQVLSFVRQ